MTLDRHQNHFDSFRISKVSNIWRRVSLKMTKFLRIDGIINLLMMDNCRWGDAIVGSFAVDMAREQSRQRRFSTGAHVRLRARQSVGGSHSTIGWIRNIRRVANAAIEQVASGPRDSAGHRRFHGGLDRFQLLYCRGYAVGGVRVAKASLYRFSSLDRLRFSLSVCRGSISFIENSFYPTNNN